MVESETDVDLERAERARQRLSRDLGRMGERAKSMTEQARASLKYGVPLLIGVALAGALAGMLLRPRAPRPRVRLDELDMRPSFLSEALRTAALSSVSVLAARIARGLPLPLLDESPRPG